jgi:hypothetical protein
MIVTIHQPEHLPWLGFFDKADQADLLILLDVVQYRKDYFQNRNRILGPGGPAWLTVPVVKTGYMDRTIGEMRINNEVAVHNGVDWRRVHWQTIRHAYAHHPHFESVAGPLEAIYSTEWALLADLNERLIRTFIDALGIRTPIVRASGLGVAGTGTELLLDICRRTDASAYLSGPTGRDYLDEAPFREAGIGVAYHAFDHPEYPQRHSGAFVSHLSTLDLLCNCGPESLSIIRSGRASPPVAGA